MSITRRSFLKGLAALAASAGITVPAFVERRKPYVNVGEVVNYIGPGGRDHNGVLRGFTGGQIVREIGEWDGVGYPVTTATNGYPSQPDVYYDVDLVNFNREVPSNFWHNPDNWKKYPNLHTYVRTQRYGESTKQAIVALNMASSEDWLAAL